MAGDAKDNPILAPVGNNSVYTSLEHWLGLSRMNEQNTDTASPKATSHNLHPAHRILNPQHPSPPSTRRRRNHRALPTQITHTLHIRRSRRTPRTIYPLPRPTPRQHRNPRPARIRPVPIQDQRHPLIIPIHDIRSARHANSARLTRLPGIRVERDDIGCGARDEHGDVGGTLDRAVGF